VAERQTIQVDLPGEDLLLRQQDEYKYEMHVHVYMCFHYSSETKEDARHTAASKKTSSKQANYGKYSDPSTRRYMEPCRLVEYSAAQLCRLIAVHGQHAAVCIGDVRTASVTSIKLLHLHGLVGTKLGGSAITSA
jgi:hypothetical protein